MSITMADFFPKLITKPSPCPTSQLTICHPLPGQEEVVTTTCVIMMTSNRLASFLLPAKIITSKRKILSRATFVLEKYKDGKSAIKSLVKTI
ncbi:unannotated protein [freshwater metagenome]|uniref:Unannotated protein n=1 Tax=freshwater metagenome TaxID=449393 RepID=A0A6J7VQE2_9ZZZZ